ncbi:hypothetical protein M0812_28049 [Anaeramoeba flamelloides]|uniref:Uncharacterized protein n=1 Tax=Anaeramoeba flamelloides TaxID=1746091 RepID=A0AAV7YDP4_9EUKA|nr:hypothetical protein M0812_28049 [Anaeramoeba flamelloides]
MSISSFLKTHPELEKIKKDFQSLKSYNSRFQTLLKLQPESFSGLYCYQLEKTWIKKHTKKMYLYGPHKVKIQKDCISDLSFLTCKTRRTIERGVNTFFKKNFNLQNCSYYSRDWLTFKLTNLKEIENLKKIKKKFKRKGKEKGKVKGKRDLLEKRSHKRDKHRKRKRKYRRNENEAKKENENFSYGDKGDDLGFDHKSGSNSLKLAKKKIPITSIRHEHEHEHEHEHKRKLKLGHFQNRSQNSLNKKKPKFILKTDLEKQKKQLNTRVVKNDINTDQLKKTKNINVKAKNEIHLREKIISTTKSQNILLKLYKSENEANQFLSVNQNMNENKCKNDHALELEQNSPIMGSENFDIYGFDDPNSDSCYEDMFGFNYDDNGNGNGNGNGNENGNGNVNNGKNNNKIDQLYIIEPSQMLNDGELAADIEFVNKNEKNVVISESDFTFLKSNFSIEREMDENFVNFFHNDGEFMRINEINDPLEC